VEVPARIRWAIDLLDVQPGNRILEVGCGTGVAVALVCDRLTRGRITAIDRSATAIERAWARNRDHVRSGRAALRNVDLAGFRGTHDQFDKAFAVNVNVFWVGDAESECEVLRRVLGPGGVLRLVYGDDPSGGTRDVGGRVTPKLARHGFTSRVTRHRSSAAVCITARLRR
jgi:SAM-dependent methyltransferase